MLNFLKTTITKIITTVKNFCKGIFEFVFGKQETAQEVLEREKKEAHRKKYGVLANFVDPINICEPMTPNNFPRVISSRSSTPNLENSSDSESPSSFDGNKAPVTSKAPAPFSKEASKLKAKEMKSLPIKPIGIPPMANKTRDEFRKDSRLPMYHAYPIKMIDSSNNFSATSAASATSAVKPLIDETAESVTGFFSGFVDSINKLGKPASASEQAELERSRAELAEKENKRQAAIDDAAQRVKAALRG